MKSQRMKGQETELSKAQCQESASLGTRFLVMGSLNYDYIYSLDNIVEPGETIDSVKLDKACTPSSGSEGNCNGERIQDWAGRKRL